MAYETKYTKSQTSVYLPTIFFVLKICLKCHFDSGTYFSSKFLSHHVRCDDEWEVGLIAVPLIGIYYQIRFVI